MQRLVEFFRTVSQNVQRIILIGGALLLAASLVAGFFVPALFFRAYLVAFVFWFGLAMGCLAILMLHHLSGGIWGAALLPILRAGSRTLPWLTLIGLPLYLSIPSLYPWARPGALQADPSLQQKMLYLNVPFFVGRTIFYFVVWNAMVFYFDRLSREWERTRDPMFAARLRRWGALGLVVFGLTISFAVIDWIMSLEPDWFSTIFPSLVAVGGVLSGFAFAVFVFVMLARRPPVAGVSSPRLLNDMGSLILAFVILWAYLAFSQYLLIWTGNLSQEIPWYVHRLSGGWQLLAVIIGICYFVLPFIFLIVREVKRHAWLLAPVMLVLVATRWIEVYWLIMPSMEPTLTLNLLDVASTLGMGGVWLWLFAFELRKRPLVADADALIEGAKEWAHEAKAEAH